MSKDENNINDSDLELSKHEILRREKLKELQGEGKDPFDVYKVEVTHNSKEINENFEELEEKVTIKTAGRLVRKRVQGKAGFSDIIDRYGKLQIYIRLDNIGKEKLDFFKTLDLGDWLSVEGTLFKTRTGAKTLRVTNFELISKSLKPLPDKWGGLVDEDLRYRHREVDLIVNQDVRDTFIKRTQIINEIRNFLNERGFLEVETPILSTVAGGAAAKPFNTHHNALHMDMYLRIATELYLKRLIVGGFEKVYDMGKNFRNEGLSNKHNPEFTMIELYEAYADYNDMMDITENMISSVSEKVNGTMKVEYGETEIDFTPPWRRVTMVDIVKEHTGVNFDEVDTLEKAHEIAEEFKLHKEFKYSIGETSKGDVLNAMFEKYCEEHLIQPTFVYDYPVEISPLTKKKRGNPEYTERFEGFIYGREICNAYSELNDPIVQRERFEQQANERELGDDEAYVIDEDFLSALETGMPPTGGLGIGIDRIIMFLTNNHSIRDVILFPTMKPLGHLDRHEDLKDSKDEEKAEETIDFSKVEIEPLFEDMVDFETFSKSDFRAVKVLDCQEVPKSRNLLEFTLDDGSGEERTILSGIKSYYTPEELVGKTLIAITNLPTRKMMGRPSEGMILSAIHQEDGKEKLNLIVLDNHIPVGAKLY
ncbi:MAG: lysine--tRNA ligase [Clostridium sp.]|nr:lysine--tRNA ligase [Clostridium sp.]